MIGIFGIFEPLEITEPVAIIPAPTPESPEEADRVWDGCEAERIALIAHIAKLWAEVHDLQDQQSKVYPHMSRHRRGYTINEFDIVGRERTPEPVPILHAFDADEVFTVPLGFGDGTVGLDELEDDRPHAEVVTCGTAS